MRQKLCGLAVDPRLDLPARAASGEARPRVVRAVAPGLLGPLRAAAEAVLEEEPDEELERHGVIYLRRWWLRRGPADEQSSEAIYLHQIVEPDAPPAHNHPWPSASLSISGVLMDVEQLRDGARRRWRLGPGDVFFRPAAHCHRLDPGNSPALTLFATGAREQRWGFAQPGGGFSRDPRGHVLHGRRAGGGL